LKTYLSINTREEIPSQYDSPAPLAGSLRLNRFCVLFPEVAHNYERDHEFNMWYVLATESLAQIDITNQAIEEKTGLKVYNMPKIQEFFVGLHFNA